MRSTDWSTSSVRWETHVPDLLLGRPSSHDFASGVTDARPQQHRVVSALVESLACCTTVEHFKNANVRTVRS